MEIPPSPSRLFHLQKGYEWCAMTSDSTPHANGEAAMPTTPHIEGDGSWQKVTRADLRPHSSFLMNPVRKTHFWQLTLACGHVVDRWIRWLPQKGANRRRGWAAMEPSLTRLPPEPRRARCKQEPAP